MLFFAISYQSMLLIYRFTSDLNHEIIRRGSSNGGELGALGSLVETYEEQMQCIAPMQSLLSVVDCRVCCMSAYLATICASR